MLMIWPVAIPGNEIFSDTKITQWLFKDDTEYASVLLDESHRNHKER